MNSAAIDTNVIVRFLTRDDPEQARLAADRIGQGAFVSHGVLMETEWVLRGPYGWDRRRINNALSTFLRLESVETAFQDDLSWALDYHSRGADWADMLHLIAAKGQAAFVTFDKDLGRRGIDGPIAIELLA